MKAADLTGVIERVDRKLRSYASDDSGIDQVWHGFFDHPVRIAYRELVDHERKRIVRRTGLILYPCGFVGSLYAKPK